MRRLFLSMIIMIIAINSIYGQSVTSESWGIYKYNKTTKQWIPQGDLETSPVIINHGTISTTFHKGDSLMSEFITLDLMYNDNNDMGSIVSVIGDDKDLKRVHQIWTVVSPSDKVKTIRIFTRGSKNYMLAFDIKS